MTTVEVFVVGVWDTSFASAWASRNRINPRVVPAITRNMSLIEYIAVVFTENTPTTLTVVLFQYLTRTSLPAGELVLVKY